MNKKKVKFVEVPIGDYLKMCEAMQKIHQISANLYYHAINNPQERNKEIYRIYELSGEQE